MKTSVKLILLSIAAFSAIYISVATSALDFLQKKYPPSDSIFLKTHWKQMGGFELFTPDKLRLGCWSTALAQIMNYHHLQPSGRIVYTSSKGFNIDEDLDSTKLNFTDLPMQIDDNTSLSDIRALAKYSYYAALAVQKDFGTDNYLNKLAPSSLLEKHYKAKVARYICWYSVLPYTPAKLKRLIREEISNNRPLFLHFANLENFGHSVVIDGYKQIKNAFLIHLNQGQGGPHDGWYNFDQDLLKEGDQKLRVIYTFKPL
jgi:hypothetical protein